MVTLKKKKNKNVILAKSFSDILNKINPKEVSIMLRIDVIKDSIVSE